MQIAKGFVAIREELYTPSTLSRLKIPEAWHEARSECVDARIYILLLSFRSMPVALN